MAYTPPYFMASWQRNIARLHILVSQAIRRVSLHAIKSVLQSTALRHWEAARAASQYWHMVMTARLVCSSQEIQGEWLLPGGAAGGEANGTGGGVGVTTTGGGSSVGGGAAATAGGGVTTTGGESTAGGGAAGGGVTTGTGGGGAAARRHDAQAVATCAPSVLPEPELGMGIE